MSRGQRIVAVPVDYALAFDAQRGWHYVDAPPAWWFEQQDALLARDGESLAAS